MLLSYRGTRYQSHTFNTTVCKNTTNGTYRGINYIINSCSTVTKPYSPSSQLKYRGISYTTTVK
jgi:Domain of unknown function (DUF4278)